MNLLIFIHVLAMFFAFAFTTGAGIFLSITLGSEDVAAIRNATRVNRRLGVIGGILLIIGLIIGFAVAGQTGMSMTATWLVVTYIAVAIILILGFGVFMPFAGRISAAADASGAQPSADLKALLANPMPRIAGPIAGLMWIVVIAMMVLRPQ